MVTTNSSSATAALWVSSVRYRYGTKLALDGLDLRIESGEIFGLLGPNGSGKTTLFRLVSTLGRLQDGDIAVFGRCIRTELAAVRSQIGIVFQSPSLDRKLTVQENLRCQSALYGLAGSARDKRIDEVLDQLGLMDRRHELTETLSGGLKRRVEIAKGVLHRPTLMLMDEPSTGLDPAARLDLWHVIESLRIDHGVTVVLTTHLLEEADKVDRLAILHHGKVVAKGAPMELRSELGQQVLRVEATDLSEVRNWLGERGVAFQEVESGISIRGAAAAKLIAPISESFGDRLKSITLAQPSLEDVFVAKTNHRFW